jgi:hypothetical protein
MLKVPLPWKATFIKAILLLRALMTSLASIEEKPKWKFSPVIVIFDTWMSKNMALLLHMMLMSESAPACPLRVKLETFVSCTGVDKLWLPVMNSRIDPVVKHSFACRAHCSRVRQEWPEQFDESETFVAIIYLT